MAMAAPLQPGHVRVLVEHSADNQLIQMATALIKAASSSPDPTSSGPRTSSVPPDLYAMFVNYVAGLSQQEFQGLTVDPTFGVLPIGPGGDEKAIPPDSLHPENSKKFLLRGSVALSDVMRGEGRIGKERVYADPMIGSCDTSLDAVNTVSARAVGVAETVQEALGKQFLAHNDLDGAGVAIAIVDTGIYLPRLEKVLGKAPALDKANSWKSDIFTVTEPGRHRIGHGTMCAYNALLAAPKATLLDIAMLIARVPGDHRVKPTVSAAMQAYGHLINKWVTGPRPNYKALVVSNSWGIYHPSLDEFPPGHACRFIDNPKHIFHHYVSLLADAGADIVFCGANCGPECQSAACLSQTDGMIMGANAYPEVLTVGGCDIRGNLVGYSSHGPAITGLKREKPDITAYTHFLGSKTRRSYLPDTGVSTACPVTAGCIAALRTRLSPSNTPPSDLFDVLRRTARGGRNAGAGGAWNEKFGFGIIDPVAAAYTLGLVRGTSRAALNA
jgi:subtilisin family serine protease